MNEDERRTRAEMLENARRVLDLTDSDPDSERSVRTLLLCRDLTDALMDGHVLAGLVLGESN